MQRTGTVPIVSARLRSLYRFAGHTLKKLKQVPGGSLGLTRFRRRISGQSTGESFNLIVQQRGSAGRLIVTAAPR